MRTVISKLGPYAKPIVLVLAWCLALLAEAAGVDIGVDPSELWQEVGAAVALVFLTPAPGYVRDGRMTTAVGLPLLDEDGVPLTDEDGRLLLDGTNYTADPDRVLTVKAETRTLTVPAESRTLTVKAETRTVTA